jgi:hypothetical protein
MIKALDPTYSFTIRFKGASNGKISKDVFKTFDEKLKNVFYTNLGYNEEDYYFQIILEDGGIPVSSIKKIEYNIFLNAIKNLIEGLIKLNEKKVHNDIKHNNILFKNGKLNLIDFGLCIPLDKVYINPNPKKKYFTWYPILDYYLLTYIFNELNISLNENCTILIEILEKLLEDIDSSDITDIKTFLNKFLKKVGVKNKQIFNTLLSNFYNDMLNDLKFIEENSTDTDTDTITIDQFLYSGYTILNNKKEPYFGLEIAKKLDIYSIGLIILILKEKINDYLTVYDEFFNIITTGCLNPHTLNRMDGPLLKEALEKEIKRLEIPEEIEEIEEEETLSKLVGGNKKLYKPVNNYNKLLKNLKLKKSNIINFKRKINNSYDYNKWINNLYMIKKSFINK